MSKILKYNSIVKFIYLLIVNLYLLLINLEILKNSIKTAGTILNK